jgi:hypothetical protein
MGRPGWPRWLARVAVPRVATRENLAALVLCLILIALVIVTADNAPQWIYQGF